MRRPVQKKFRVQFILMPLRGIIQNILAHTKERFLGSNNPVKVSSLPEFSVGRLVILIAQARGSRFETPYDVSYRMPLSPHFENSM